ncbi:MAG: glycosyltransferase family 2 protein, partial [Chloroflexi bacterium]|nr:glycosyltransferase family 2 protein [Chloroflexota bacterium]
MLSVVVVSWNVAPLLRRCLASVLAGASGRALDVWVVDNGSRDASVALVRREFSQVQVIANERNHGYAAAVNQGLVACRGRAVLLLNPDAELLGDALRVMADYLDAHPNVGVVGPRLVYPNGRTQPSRRRFPTLTTALRESTPAQRFWPDSPAVRHYYVADRPDEAEQDVDWLVGAALLVRRSAIDEVGLLDEDFPVYWEETDWQRRMRQAGWRIVYLPHACVLHHEAQSTSQARLRRHLWFQQGKVCYFAKHHGPRAAAAVRAALVVSYALQLAEEGLKYLLVPRKRPQRGPYLAVLAATLCALLRLRPAPRIGDAPNPARAAEVPSGLPVTSLPRSPSAALQHTAAPVRHDTAQVAPPHAGGSGVTPELRPSSSLAGRERGTEGVRAEAADGARAQRHRSKRTSPPGHLSGAETGSDARETPSLPATARLDFVPQEYQLAGGALNTCGPYALSVLVNAWRP